MQALLLVALLLEQQPRSVSDALRRGGIPAAAALMRNYEGEVSADPENNVETLAQLVAWHSLIVIGRVGSHKAWLTSDDETIVTDYEIAVERVLKGDAVRRITVSVQGGSVRFADGSTATLTSTMRLPMIGERYLLFLVPSWFPASPGEQQAAAGTIYTPQHLSLSVYLLNPDGRVTPRGRPDHPLQKDMAQRTEADLVREILKLLL